MIEGILLILHVVNGNYIIIYNVIWYNFLNSNTNSVIIILMFVQLLFLQDLFNDVYVIIIKNFFIKTYHV